MQDRLECMQEWNRIFVFMRKAGFAIHFKTSLDLFYVFKVAQNSLIL